MQNRNQFESFAYELSEESFNNVTPYSFELALTRGIIVEVTDWVLPDIGFGKGCFRVRVALTTRLWDVLLQTYVRLKNGQAMEACKNRNDVLWLAAQALRRAEQAGSQAANFEIYLPSLEEALRYVWSVTTERSEACPK